MAADQEGISTHLWLLTRTQLPHLQLELCLPPAPNCGIAVSQGKFKSTVSADGENENCLSWL